MKKILVIQTAFLGDVLLATAIIEKLSAYYPNAELHFMLKKGNESLLHGHPKIAKLWIWDKTNGKYSNLWNLLRKAISSSFDIIVNLQRHWSTAFFTIFACAKYSVGFRTTPLAWFYSKSVKFRAKYCHELERNQELITAITDTQPANAQIYPDLQAKLQAKKIATLPKPYITISAVSHWETKTYPMAKWVEFLQQISQELSVYFLGAAEDSKFVEQIICATSNNKLRMKNCCGQLNLIPSGILMQGAIMNYTLDSVATHLASAMDAPVCTLFLSTSPIFGFGPRASKAHIIMTETKLLCQPCTNHGRRKCPKGHFQCAYSLDTSLLLDKLMYSL